MADSHSPEEASLGEVISSDVKPLVVPGGDNTAEVVTTPTEAAAAGDISIEFSATEKGGDSADGAGEARIATGVAMGNTGSGEVTGIQIRAAPDYATEMVKVSEPASETKKALNDQYPATELWTAQSGGMVKLRMSDKGDGAIKPVTVPSMMRETVNKVPDAIAMGVKRNGAWKKWTYKQYYSESWQAAKAMMAVGLQSHHAVGILGFNAPEWFISYLGTMFAGGKAMGIYTTNNPEACEYVLQDSEANVVVVENNQQLQKILKVWEKLPHLKAIIQYTGEVAERRKNVYSWEEFLRLSSDIPDAMLEERMSTIAPNMCCSLIYTSGTTGNPKAVMLSHDNCTFTAYQSGKMTKLSYTGEVLVSFLPLSHIAAQLLDLLMPIMFGNTVYFAQPDALKGTLTETWKDVHPTVVFAVPRVWEKIQEKLVSLGRQSSNMKRKIGAWAKAKGLKGMEARNKGTSMPFGWGIANALVFKKVRQGLGLDRCRLFGSGAAPISKETLDYFSSLDIRVDETYGMSESTGPHSFCMDGQYRITSVGKELYGVQTKIDQPDQDGNGEICFYGRHVFMGYLNQEEKTRETLDADGWLHSGDIGKKDKDDFLYITGRIKEIIITAGGENVAPVPIEDNVKEAIPAVSNCMLVGDKRKFLSMLITLKTDMNLDTNEPLPTLTLIAREWCQSLGSPAKTVQEALEDTKIIKGIQAGVDAANEKAVSRAAKIQKWSLLPIDFSIPGGELGPTLKLRRPIVVKKYEKTISAFYEE